MGRTAPSSMLIVQEAFKKGLNTKVLKNTRLNKPLVLLLVPAWVMSVLTFRMAASSQLRRPLVFRYPECCFAEIAPVVSLRLMMGMSEDGCCSAKVQVTYYSKQESFYGANL